MEVDGGFEILDIPEAPSAILLMDMILLFRPSPTPLVMMCLQNVRTFVSVQRIFKLPTNQPSFRECEIILIFAAAGVASVELRTFVLLPREVRVVLNDQGLFSPDHLKSLLSWVLVLKFVHVQVTPRSPINAGSRRPPDLA